MAERTGTEFTGQGLEDAVEEALGRSEVSFGHEVDPESLSIRLHTTEEYNSSGEAKDFEIFEELFNPSTGTLREFPDDLSYLVKIRQTLTAVYEAEAGARTISFDADEIERIQEESIQNSFTEGYSEERFRELYEAGV